VREELGRQRLRQRHDSLLPDHYVGLHVTVVSVVLGVAGIAAASLLTPSSLARGYQPLFWILWVVSLLATATVYAGVMVGAFLLPARIPNVWDLCLPLLQALSELLLFAVLSAPLTGLKSPRSAVIVWLSCIAIFGALASLSILRARWLIKPDSYAPDVREVVHRYTQGLFADVAGATAVAVVGTVAAVVLGFFRNALLADAYAVAVGVGTILILGLASHARAATSLHRGIE